MTVKRWMLGFTVVGVVLLTACNPLVGQPTKVRTGGVSKSGHITFAGTAPGWLEVSVRDSPDATVSVSAGGQTRAGQPGSCLVRTGAFLAWSGGSGLGYQRLARIGPDTDLKLTFTAPTEGTTFDVRVVDDAGTPVGEVAHELPTTFDDVGTPIGVPDCP